MANLKKSILLLGEGPTEFFYFNSVRNLFKGVTIAPDYPKHTNLKELKIKIEEGIKSGYNYVFCVIDMDTKEREPEHSQYLRLKQKFSKPIIMPKHGIHCEVKFYETHRCTELFFLYYFCYSSKMYLTQEALLKDLNRKCVYEKSCNFFIKTKGLHAYFEKNGGSLDKAVENAELSLKERMNSGRNYTFSELGAMVLELLQKQEQS